MILLKGARLVDPAVNLDGIFDLLIDGQNIVEVASHIDAPEAQVRTMTGKVVVPGLVDIHVHLREPGYEYKETIATGTRAAAHGGFVGVAPMPNTKPACDTGSKVSFLVEKAREEAAVRVFPVGSLTMGLEGTALSEMGDMVAAGAVAFSDDGRGVQDDGTMRRAMDYAKMFGKTVMSHCQSESLSGHGVVNEGVVSTRLGMAGWPAQAEEIQISRDLLLCELTGCHLHLQHVTTAGGLDLIRAAKGKGLPVTCEVTPHHLFLDEDSLDETYDTNLKMNPPLRTVADREALIAALLDGTVDCIASDHAPHAAHEKSLEFELAPFGTVGLETSLPLVMTELVSKNILDYAGLVRLMAINPRNVIGVPQVTLQPGSIADLTVIDPGVTHTITSDYLLSRSRNSAFLDWTLKGFASDVYVAGQAVLEDEELTK